MTTETTNTGEPENEVDKQAAPSDTSPIYVDDSRPATLHYSEKSVSYPTLREAIIAWQALPHDVKKVTSIQSDLDGALYRGWEIYRLWGR